MEKDKYYTPTIEEFHVGFEYEYSVSGDEGTWETTSLNGDFYEKEHEVTYLPMRIRNSNTKIHAGRVRVKHLDREDIESFGWEFKKEKNKAMLFEMLKDDFNGRRRSKLIMAFNPISQWVCIALVIEKFEEKNEERTFFAGNTKNKSEFKRILTQIGVI